VRSPAHQFLLDKFMNDPNSDSKPAAPRVTLKLKVAPRKPQDPIKAPPTARPNGKTELKPGAHWSDEYKRRMQADMDDLLSK
jgi:hypothetical protein